MLDDPYRAAIGRRRNEIETPALLVAMAPLIGTARVVCAAPKLGLALGYDIDADIEGLDHDPEVTEAPVERVDAGIGQR